LNDGSVYAVLTATKIYRPKLNFDLHTRTTATATTTTITTTTIMMSLQAMLTFDYNVIE